jgi:hypothetical protein
MLPFVVATAFARAKLQQKKCINEAASEKNQSKI